MIGRIKGIFNKKQEPTTILSSEIETAPLQNNLVDTDKLLPVIKPPIMAQSIRLELSQFIVGCGHSVGRQRDHNEDAMFTITTNLIADDTQIPFGLYIIADGMGGHEHGEIASGVAVRVVAAEVLQKIYLTYLGLSDLQAEESVQEILQQGVMQAHREILTEAQGGGTTLTAALLMGDKMTIAHVGDSRAYIIFAQGIQETLTQDHSLVKRLEELGQITADEAAVHPQRNVLYRALGQGDPFQPDVATFPLPRACHLLICSDGLWGVIPEKELLGLVNSSPDPQQACQSLIDAANAAGGPDNITVILVRLPD
ncbi:MAG TPA: protein phosphatase 2C domain-containing protein [Anaerolineales bacterium]|nr:protein phosphatase 2C domain-containing protein [Anaerolineales bacterium]